MKSALAILFLLPGIAFSESISCAREGFPRLVEKPGLLTIDQSGPDKLIIALIPRKHEGEKLVKAYTIIGDPGSISIPLALHESSVKDYKGFLVAYIQTEQNNQSITVQATYGHICTTILHRTENP
ncbi:hypothetical protein ACJJI4_12080 [Microbulbifer sp. TRSA002]|uniref:hypothetical protein n=1 Tax=Microbulbifer sp. TRSA002 TaxID=3243382 RepID=UPI004039804C